MLCVRPAYLSQHVRRGEPAHVGAQERRNLRQPLRVRFDELLLNELRYVRLAVGFRAALPRRFGSAGLLVLESVEGFVVAGFQERRHALALIHFLADRRNARGLRAGRSSSRVGELEIPDELPRRLRVERLLFVEYETFWHLVLQDVSLHHQRVRLPRECFSASFLPLRIS